MIYSHPRLTIAIAVGGRDRGGVWHHSSRVIINPHGWAVKSLRRWIAVYSPRYARLRGKVRFAHGSNTLLGRVVTPSLGDW